MAATVEGLRKYLRLMPDSDDELSLWLNAARDKAKAAGIPDFKNNASYDLFLYALAAMYYDNRGMGFSGSYQQAAGDNATNMINNFVLSLRYSEDGEGDV